MDRYKDLSSDTHISRTEQNKKLYESNDSNVSYTTISNVTSSNIIDLSKRKDCNTREGYHQMKEYQNVMPVPKVKKELDEFNSLYKKNTNRVYDINNVLEEARKNRGEVDELDSKRKLKDNSYNILSDLTKEKLEKYRKEKENKVIKPSDEDLRETIDTIASATLAGDIKAASDLLSDLMATSIMEKVSYGDDASTSDEGIADNIRDVDDKTKELEDSLKESDLEKINEIALEDTEISEFDSIDHDFYTKSMDLSNEDFEVDEEFVDKKMPMGIKILIIIIILVVIVSVGYFIYVSL